jgi:phosphopantetheinyl transferase
MKLFVLQLDARIHRQAQKNWRDAFLLLVCQAHFPKQQISLSDFKIDVLGKPYLVPLPFAFSISKIPGLIAILAAEDIEALGVDIVADQQHLLLPDLDIYTDAERQQLSQQPEWYPYIYARKEAVLKAVGCGFRYEPKCVDVQQDSIDFQGKSYRVHSFRTDLLQATIAICVASAKRMPIWDMHLYTIEHGKIVGT